MSTRIRLQRHGRKGRPIFTIVVADQRAKRDGKFIEKLGQYNPNTNPATIDLNFDRAVDWVIKGAQPTHTARALLSYKGVLLKKHLIEGVRKGALTEDQMEEKFGKWLEEKETLIQNKRERLANESAAQKKARLEAEAEANAKRQEAIAAKNTPAPEVTEEAPAEEAAPEAATEEAPAQEEAAEAKAEEVAETATEEEPVKEEATPEAATEEAPAKEEVKAKETPVKEEEVKDKKAEEATAEEAPVKEEATQDAKAEEAPAKEEAATDAKAEEAPAEDDGEASAEGETEEKAG